MDFPDPSPTHHRSISATSTMTSGSEHLGGTNPGGKKSKQQSFIQKLFRMATSSDHANIFAFSEDGACVEIRNPANLGPILIRYFKHSNTSSFIRQLNNYGFKTISSMSTGKNIQTFAHPHFHRDAKEVVDTITRKTAKSLKKCKRDIIRELQTAETEYRRKLRELELRNQRLEQHNEVLDRENMRLAQDLKRFEGSTAAPDELPLPSVTAMPVLTSSCSSRRSSIEPSSSSSGEPSHLEPNSDYSDDSPPFSKPPHLPNFAYPNMPHHARQHDFDDELYASSASSTASSSSYSQPHKRMALDTSAYFHNLYLPTVRRSMNGDPEDEDEQGSADDVDILSSLAHIEAVHGDNM
jgi:hypothetical protein